MGCTGSKIENEEVVATCVRRRKYMKEAVEFRHHFAAAHARYAQDLKYVGSGFGLFGDSEYRDQGYVPLNPKASYMDQDHRISFVPGMPPLHLLELPLCLALCPYSILSFRRWEHKCVLNEDFGVTFSFQSWETFFKAAFMWRCL